MSEKIKIFVADDHPIVREGLIAILETQDDFEIVGEASNGQETVELIEQLSVDILMTDLEMPKLDGLEVIKKLQNKKQAPKIIVFTVFDTDERIVNAIKAGAKGYLLKGASRQDIYAAVRTVYDGGTLLQPLVASKLFNHLNKPPETLSPRELEVLGLLGKGKTNQSIAKELFISERTVKFHVSSILGKLGAKNRTDALQLALKKGLINL